MSLSRLAGRCSLLLSWPFGSSHGRLTLAAIYRAAGSIAAAATAAAAVPPLPPSRPHVPTKGVLQQARARRHGPLLGLLCCSLLRSGHAREIQAGRKC